MPKEYRPEIIAAALRVARIFDTGCDRCDADDLELLERSGLMETSICRDTFGQDSLEIGETMWTFNAEGKAITKVLFAPA